MVVLISTSALPLDCQEIVELTAGPRPHETFSPLAPLVFPRLPPLVSPCEEDSECHMT